MKFLRIITICMLLISFLLTGTIFSKEVSGDMSVGYVLTDDTNDQSLLYERYNYYDGANLSLNNFVFNNNGITYRADLNNITMNNRNLLLSIYKPTKFKITARHNKFRRVYNSSGSIFTRRNLTDISGDFNISERLQVFGSFTNHQNKGTRLYVTESLIDSLNSTIDYSSQITSGGFNYSSSLGNINAQYSHTNYDDIDSLYIQKSNLLNVNGSFLIPGYNKYRISSGFTYQQNELDNANFKQNNYQAWAGSKISLAKKFMLEYRFLYNRAKHEAKQIETDNWQHLVSLSKRWASKFGLRVGYDYVITDDLLNKTTRNGFLLNGWAKLNKYLFLKFETNYYDKNLDYGTTLYGNTIYNRNKFAVRYSFSNEVTVSGDYLSRIREIETLNSKIDYGKYSGNIKYNKPNVAKFSGTFSYAKGDYKNQSDSTSYLFNNYYINGSITPEISDRIYLTFNTTYYSLKKDEDFRKIVLSGKVGYEIIENWQFNVKVNSFNVEDYLLDNNYEGYVLAFNLVNHFGN